MFRTSLSKQIPVFSLLTGATVWGLFWYPYRILAALGMSGWMSLTLSYMAALILGMAFFRKSIWSPGFSWMLLWIGISAGLCNIGYVLAMIDGEVMRVLLLFYLAPFWTVLLARMILGEKLSAQGILVMSCAMAGAVVMLWDPQRGSIFPQSKAEWLGLGAGFMFALSNVLAKSAQAYSIEAKSASISVGVVAAGLLFEFFHPSGEGFSVYALMLLAVMGAVIFAVNVVMQYGLTHTPANRAIVILLFELVVAAVSSYFLAGEAMTLREWLGGGMIVAASLLSGKLEKV
ncbi:MAG: DMT family transporter [Burkholderiales bacterium]|nr:DMT family transporter [Burkholderiales bacterium]